MKHSNYISSFKTKLEAISGSELTEQEAVESFYNLSGFIQTLIEIDKSLKNKPQNQQNRSNENANIRSSNISN